MIEKKIKTLRTLKTHSDYELHCAKSHSKACYLCSAPSIKAYKHWRIIENQFPYDEVATMNNMVVSLRHAKEDDLTPDEKAEYQRIKADLHDEYDMIVENTHKQKSIPGHFHLHLLKIRERLMKFEEKRPCAVFLTAEAKTMIQSGP